jgi:hypothetical protein
LELKSDRRKLTHSHSVDMGSLTHYVNDTLWNRQAMHHDGGRELPPVSRPHERAASVSTVSTSGPSAVSQHVGHGADSVRETQFLRAGSHSPDQRPRSDLLHVHRGTARRLEIRCSVTEGRRLVFPDDTPSVPENPSRQSTSSTSRTESESHNGNALALIPERSQEHSKARTTLAPALWILDDGTAIVEKRAVLQSDLGWLCQSPPKLVLELQPEEEHGHDCNQMRQLALATPRRTKGESVEGTSSAKKRKRLEAFASGRGHMAAASMPPVSPTKRRGKSSPSSDQPSPTTSIEHFGRMAIKQELAMQFLGLAKPSDFDFEAKAPKIEKDSKPSKVLVDCNPLESESPTSPMSNEGESVSTQAQHRVAPNVPDWPDLKPPWAHEATWQQKCQLQQIEMLDKEKASSLERYLSASSEDESGDADSRIVLMTHLKARGKTSKTSSDAREAVLHARQKGKPFLKRDLEAGAVLPIITPAEEAGCLCGGHNEEGGGMVCCDGCSIWYHLSCCGIETEDELEDQWFCQRCDPSETPARTEHVLNSPLEPVGVPVTPRLRQALGPTFSATNETSRSYHAHTSDAALAPSPTFSPGAHFPVSLMDTPALYAGPRIPSGSSVASKFATPGTPMTHPKPRIVSYAEHYNVCQTPGAPDSDYKKIYSTPKFEDFFDTGVMQSGSTPMHRNPGSPTPLNKSRLGGLGLPAFTTPTSSQNFLKSLQIGATGSTPALDFLPSSASGSSHSPFPISPVLSVNRVKYPSVITDSISPSPYREHRRQVSFGARSTSFSASASHLRDSVTFEGVEKGPLDLGGELKAPPSHNYAI